MADKQLRHEFETWFADGGSPPMRHGDDYASVDACAAWCAWTAAISAINSKQPDPGVTPPKTFEQAVREVVAICDALAEAKETEAEWCFDFARAIAAKVEEETKERCAHEAATTICDKHLPTGVSIYGTRAATAIRALPSKYKEPT